MLKIECNKLDLRFFIAVPMNSTAFWVVTSCSSENARCFGENVSLPSSGLKSTVWKNQVASRPLFFLKYVALQASETVFLIT
jgi:hypothetical protein